MSQVEKVEEVYADWQTKVPQKGNRVQKVRGTDANRLGTITSIAENGKLRVLLDEISTLQEEKTLAKQSMNNFKWEGDAPKKGSEVTHKDSGRVGVVTEVEIDKIKVTLFKVDGVSEEAKQLNALDKDMFEFIDVGDAVEVSVNPQENENQATQKVVVTETTTTTTTTETIVDSKEKNSSSSFSAIPFVVCFVAVSTYFLLKKFFG